MPIVKFIINTDRLRQPKLVLKIINNFLMSVMGEVYLEQPAGYLTEEDLNDG